MTKKVKKDLQDSKNSSIFAAENGKRVFVTPLTYRIILEQSSSVPCEALKPNEAMGIREMLQRTERGQRLNVHTRMRNDDCPDNMYHMEFNPDGTMKPDPLGETIDHTPPGDINDIVDVQRYQEELAARKQALKDKYKKKVASAPESAPAPGDADEGDQHTPEKTTQRSKED